MDTEMILRRFTMERQNLANLEHPNIARLLEGGSTPDGLPYFVMEYIEGQPINRYCDSRHFSTAERLTIFREICGAPLRSSESGRPSRHQAQQYPGNR